MKVMEAQSQFPGHILEVAETVAAARAAAVMMAGSPRSCCWKRKGCETHLRASRAAASLPANWAGPWGEDSPGREGKAGLALAELPGLSSPWAAAAPVLFSLLFWFCHRTRWESHMSLFTGRGSCPAAGFCSSALPPLPPHIHKHTHKHVVFGWQCPCWSSCQPESGLICLGLQPERLGSRGRRQGWFSLFREN